MVMKRPLWLRWQPLRCSPWLGVYLAAALFLPLLAPAFLEWRRDGTEFWQAYETWAHRYDTGALWLFYILYALATAGFLVWFTYFSRSPRVKDADRLFVFLMLCGASVGWIIMIVRALARM